MWSASTWYGFAQPSAFTAASAAARVVAGPEPMIVCSRFDLFQTGTTSIPRSAARTQARSCGFACRVVGQFLSEDAAGREVNRQVKAFLGPRGAAAVEDMVTAAAKPGQGTLPTIISLAILFFTASGVFVELRGALNAIWGIDPKA